MPSYLRRFYLNKLLDTKKEENKKIEDANKSISKSSNSNIIPKFRR